MKKDNTSAAGAAPFATKASSPSATEVAGHIAEAKATKLPHTPGPWQAQHDFDMNGACTIVGNVQDHDGDYGEVRLTCTTICDINEEPDEWLANRALIIAAPDLLEACKAAEEWLAGWASAEPYIDVIRAAIKRATEG